GTSNGNADGLFAHEQDSRGLKRGLRPEPPGARKRAPRQPMILGPIALEWLMSYVLYKIEAFHPLPHPLPMQPSSPSFSPLYQQIKALILQSLQAGEWKPAEPIPSEIDLAARFGVSQGTVRKAMDELAAENRVVRRQGKGTFVTTHAEQHAQYRFLKLVPDKGTPDSEGPADRLILGCERLRATADIARALAL